MKWIPLSWKSAKRDLTTVDDDYYPILNRYTWSVEIHKNGRKYAARMANGRKHYMHRDVFRLASGFYPPRVDHRDRNGLNNQRGNLRAVTHQGNMRNKGPRADNRIGYPGVRPRWRKRGDLVFQAFITAPFGRQIYLGSFEQLYHAVCVRQFATNLLHGDTACQFIDAYEISPDHEALVVKKLRPYLTAE